MGPLAHVVMFSWVPVVLGIFALLPPRKAVVASFLTAWLFLPMVEYDLPGLPNYTKMSATCAGVLLGMAVFDFNRLMSFRLRWFDLPVAMWCVSSLFSSLSNGLGLYDGVTAVVARVVTWGLPYLIGRLYFGNLSGLRELARGIVIGGLVYVPFCLFEVRMSPQLHRLVYGFHQHVFAQTVRFGGWRPTVFMQHGLMVGMWMTAASLVGLWLWSTGYVKRLWGIPMLWVVAAVWGTAVLCKSAGALALLAAGVASLFAVKHLRTVAPLVCLVALPLLYMAGRVSGAWSGDGLVDVAGALFGEERAISLQCRQDNENLLMEKAMQRPLFGWGGWGRNRVYDEQGEDVTITDGLWIIGLGMNGIVGLAALTLMLLAPVWMLLMKLSARQWALPAAAAVASLSVLLTLYMIDNLFNGMVNPIFTLVAGGLAGLNGTYRAAGTRLRGAGR